MQPIIMAKQSFPQWHDEIDRALGSYYTRCGRFDYFDSHHIGKFAKYIIDRPSSHSVQIMQNPVRACFGFAYHIYSSNVDEFALPNYLIIPQSNRLLFIGWITLYCCIYHQPPSDECM